MTINVLRTGNKEYGRYIKALICGEPGAGKTLISSTFPDPFYASAEGGMMSIADRGLPYAEIGNSEDLLQLRMILQQPKTVYESMLGVPVQTIVVDTIDQVSRILIEERKQATKKDSFVIADWGWLGDQVRGIIMGFRNLPMHVVFTCHLKQSEDSETGRIFFKPALSGQVGDEIAGMVDLALWLRQQPMNVVEDNQAVRKIVRILQTFQDSAHPWIKDRSGKLPQEFNVDFKTDFNRMNDLIFGSIPDLVETESVETPVEAPSRAEPAQGEETTEATEANERSEPVAEPPQEETEAEVPGWICADCGATFDNEDQADLSKITMRRYLCNPCYRVANKRGK